MVTVIKYGEIISKSKNLRMVIQRVGKIGFHSFIKEPIANGEAFVSIYFYDDSFTRIKFGSSEVSDLFMKRMEKLDKTRRNRLR